MSSQVEAGGKVAVGEEIGYLGGLGDSRVSFMRWGKNDYSLLMGGVEIARFKRFSQANDAFGLVFDAVWS